MKPGTPFNDLLAKKSTLFVTVCQIMFFCTPFNDPESRNIRLRLVTCPCVLYHDGVSSPIGTGTPGGKFCIRTDGHRYVFF